MYRNFKHSISKTICFSIEILLDIMLPLILQKPHVLLNHYFCKCILTEEQGQKLFGRVIPGKRQY